VSNARTETILGSRRKDILKALEIWRVPTSSVFFCSVVSPVTESSQVEIGHVFDSVNVSTLPSGPPSEYTSLPESPSSSGPGCRQGGISWFDVKAADFVYNGNISVVDRLFDLLQVSKDDVKPVLLHAASVSQTINEAQAFGAGDVVKASIVLSRSASETAVSLIRCEGNLALVAKEARIARGISDIRCLVGCERIDVDAEIVSIIDGYAQCGVTLPHVVTFVPSSVSQVFPKLRNLSLIDQVRHKRHDSWVNSL